MYIEVGKQNTLRNLKKEARRRSCFKMCQQLALTVSSYCDCTVMVEKMYCEGFSLTIPGQLIIMFILSLLS